MEWWESAHLEISWNFILWAFVIYTLKVLIFNLVTNLSKQRLEASRCRVSFRPNMKQDILFCFFSEVFLDCVAYLGHDSILIFDCWNRFRKKILFKFTIKIVLKPSQYFFIVWKISWFWTKVFVFLGLSHKHKFFIILKSKHWTKLTKLFLASNSKKKGLRKMWMRCDECLKTLSYFSKFLFFLWNCSRNWFKEIQNSRLLL